MCWILLNRFAMEIEAYDNWFRWVSGVFVFNLSTVFILEFNSVYKELIVETMHIMASDI